MPPSPAGDGATGRNLHASEECFRLLVESVKDYAIFMLDSQGFVSTWNAGAERIKGYTAAEIIGKHFSVFYPASEAATKPSHELAIAVAEGVYEEEGWRVRKGGSRFFASVTITPVYDTGGKLGGFAKVTRDLTERRASQQMAIDAARRVAAGEAARESAELWAREMRTLADQLGVRTAQLEQQRLAADDANRAKGEFLAAMSHELRTPLNAIGGYTQLMQMGVAGPITEEQRNQLGRIQLSQQHLLGVINDILNFSRIEAGQIEYHLADVRISDVVNAVLAMVTPQADVKHITVELRPHADEVAVMADSAKLEQILLNLLSNAIKFTADGGTIEISCDRTERYGSGQLLVRVRDTGIGIPNHQLEMIFAPFMQVGRSLANPIEGTGLGLAISRDLARGMGGDLTAESKEGEGSVFTLRLREASQAGAVAISP